MTEAFIGLGSNIEPEKYTPMALERLRNRLNVISISPFYKTPAVGTAKGQADFINGVVGVRTELTAHQLKFDVLREIEYELGRRKFMPKHAPRSMDLDLLVFGNEFIEDLNVPEPDILNRSFVYTPLLDINPNFTVPGMSVQLKSLVQRDESLEMWSPPFYSVIACKGTFH